MLLQTISEVSKRFHISTRTLRYYEKIGLINSTKTKDYAYRQYTSETIDRLQQILILRKLRLSLKDISILLNQADTKQTIRILQNNISAINGQLESYSVIKSVLEHFIDRINHSSDITIQESILNDTTLIESIQSLSKSNFKEENIMKELHKVSKYITKLDTVRIINLPPMTVASYTYIGDNWEEKAEEKIMAFVQKNKILMQNPTIRHFGFNKPIFQPGKTPGYEIWVTIPNDFEVPFPLVKKQFHGGMYAAHAIKFGQFDHWDLLAQWLEDSEYCMDFEDIRSTPKDTNMDRSMEEHLKLLKQYQ